METINFCECGCGKTVKSSNRFVKGHNTRCFSEETKRKLREIGQKTGKYYGIEQKPCECGCGQFPKDKGSKYCWGHKQRVDNSMKGKTHSEKAKEKIGASVSEWANTPEGLEIRKLKSEQNSVQNLTRERRLRISSGVRKAYEEHPELKEALRNLALEKSGGIRQSGRASYETYIKRLSIYEAVRRHPDDPNALQVQCYKCKEWMSPTTSQVIDRLYCIENINRGENHFYCSGECKQNCSIYRKRAIHPKDDLENEVPPEVSQIVRNRAKDGICERCKEAPGEHCHHINPRKCEGPGFEADIDDCIWVCVSCHLECHQKDGCSFGYLANAEFDKTPTLGT